MADRVQDGPKQGCVNGTAPPPGFGIQLLANIPPTLLSSSSNGPLPAPAAVPSAAGDMLILPGGAHCMPLHGRKGRPSSLYPLTASLTPTLGPTLAAKSHYTPVASSPRIQQPSSHPAGGRAVDHDTSYAGWVESKSNTSPMPSASTGASQLTDAERRGMCRTTWPMGQPQQPFPFAGARTACFSGSRNAYIHCRAHRSTGTAADAPLGSCSRHWAGRGIRPGEQSK